MPTQIIFPSTSWRYPLLTIFCCTVNLNLTLQRSPWLVSACWPLLFHLNSPFCFVYTRLCVVRTCAPMTEIKLAASHSSQLIGFPGWLRELPSRLRAFDMSLCIWLLTGQETGKSQLQRQPYVEHIVSVLQHISPLTAASGLTFGKVNNAWGSRLIVSCHLLPVGENSSINITGVSMVCSG